MVRGFHLIALSNAKWINGLTLNTRTDDIGFYQRYEDCSSPDEAEICEQNCTKELSHCLDSCKEQGTWLK